MGHAHLHQQQHQKRDNLGDSVGDSADELLKSQLPGVARKVRRGETYVRTVYKTMSPTFTGPIGGYSTQGQDDPQPTQAPALTTDEPQAQTELTPMAQETRPTAIEAPKSIDSADATSLGSTLAVADPTNAPAAQQPKMSSSFALPAPTSSSTAEPASKSTSDEGTSPGAKAGIAFGILGGLLLIGLVVFMVFNRRKRQLQRQRLSADDEKFNNSGSDGLARMPSHSDPRAPRISLRPVTQFLPNWNLDKNAQRGNANGAANLAPATAAGQWDRPGTSQSNHPNNPFGSGAERINNPDAPARDPWTANGPAVGASAVGAAATTAGVAALTRKTSMRKANQKDVDLTVPGVLDTVPPSPAGTEFSTSSMPAGAPSPPSQSAAAIAAAGGPPSSAVHRVQLDFKPTLEDEMELNAGDLVRLLHEYDDGWALCIRLDRSQQGVVPRTCLSTRPVKPRAPQGASRPGPPINPQGGYPRGTNQPARPTTPQGRPMTPQGNPMSPQGHRPPQAMVSGPRPTGPMSPGPRPQSPGPRYQGPPVGRPQSPNGVNSRSMGAPGPGPSPMNPAPQSPSQAPQRKPVPGQAY
ncbi:hypothetical protein V2A60_007426 [Cordyceps javanica]|uniref:SH3 domain-containing protein n=1 Tax=Cordyceps javanica TaxID=43265 RepID=A0A545W7V9_9HYPO|nr:SH3 domain-containing protein [Cordyceps javanica]TQW10084.1 SH3 domain protein [Cordyceps javanica]